MPGTFFTSDHHFGHANVLAYCNRPFASVEEATEGMVDRWNAVVKPGDRIYHLGDFALCKAAEATQIVRRLNGQKYLIFGNHDKGTRKDVTFLGQWIWARDLQQVKIGDQKITLCHYAMRTWPSSHHGAWNLHGHSHGSLQEDPHLLQIDVGVDCWDFAPVEFETLKQHMSTTKQWAPNDHHGRE